MQVAFALNCHDREVLAVIGVPRTLAGRDIQALMHRPDVPIQWLSDNGSMYMALDTLCTAERLNLVPITTPAASPQSNGMSEAFVNTLRRDYLAGADRASAAVILDQLTGWIADYNGVVPHSALAYQSPQQYRAAQGALGPMD